MCQATQETSRTSTIGNASRISKTLLCSRNKLLKADPVLSTISQYVNQGWPELSPVNHSWVLFRQEERITDLRRMFVVGIEGHSPKAVSKSSPHTITWGIVRTKGLARMYVWWPGINQDIEKTVKQCLPCQKTRAEPTEAPLHSWSWPWARTPCRRQNGISSNWCPLKVDRSNSQDMQSLLSLDCQRLWWRIMEVALPVLSLQRSSRPMVFTTSRQLHTTLPQMDWPKELCKLSRQDWRKSGRNLSF